MVEFFVETENYLDFCMPKILNRHEKMREKIVANLLRIVLLISFWNMQNIHISRSRWTRQLHLQLCTAWHEDYTVKRVDEVVPHRHLVTQDQTTQVSNKFFHIPNLLFANVELVRQSRKVSKAACGGAGANLRPTGLQSATLPLRHAFNSHHMNTWWIELLTGAE